MSSKVTPYALAGISLFAGAAQAATYDWSFVSDGGLGPDGSGQFVESGGVVTSISGIFAGENITGLLASGYFGGSSPDNAVPLTFDGLGFSLANSVTLVGDNIKFMSSGPAIMWMGYNGTAFVNCNSGTFTATEVPEPASAALLGMALTGFLAAHRRRARPSTKAA